MPSPDIDPQAPRPDQIADRIVDAILAGRITPGQRLGEQQLADLFSVSRTLVREALGRLSARGMVEVNARRGWFVVQPSPAEAREAFEARRAIEAGLLQNRDRPWAAAEVQRLRQHVADERAAIDDGEPGRRSWLLGDFHVCLAECAGNSLLADILRDLTARTTLIATLYQSTHEAAQSNAEHAAIVEALEAGDHALAVERLKAHIGSVADHLDADARARDLLDPLRQALSPLERAGSAPQAGARQASTPAPSPSPRKPRRRLFSDLVPTDRKESSE